MRTRPSPRLVALLAAVLLLPLMVVAGLAVPAGAVAAPVSANPSHGADRADPSDRHCPDDSPVSACHPRSEFPAPAPGPAPRPDLETAWGVPGRSAALAVPRPGLPDDPAPDLIALSISRT